MVVQLPTEPRVRGEGVEPPRSGSEPDGLPLADPRMVGRYREASLIVWSTPFTGRRFGEKESNLHRQLQRLPAYPLADPRDSAPLAASRSLGASEREAASGAVQRKERESNPQGSRSAVFETAAIAHWLALPCLPLAVSRSLGLSER